MVVVRAVWQLCEPAFSCLFAAVSTLHLSRVRHGPWQPCSATGTGHAQGARNSTSRRWDTIASDVMLHVVSKSQQRALQHVRTHCPHVSRCPQRHQRGTEQEQHWGLGAPSPLAYASGTKPRDCICLVRRCLPPASEVLRNLAAVCAWLDGPWVLR